MREDSCLRVDGMLASQLMNSTPFSSCATRAEAAPTEADSAGELVFALAGCRCGAGLATSGARLVADAVGRRMAKQQSDRSLVHEANTQITTSKTTMKSASATMTTRPSKSRGANYARMPGDRLRWRAGGDIRNVRAFPRETNEPSSKLAGNCRRSIEVERRSREPKSATMWMSPCSDDDEESRAEQLAPERRASRQAKRLVKSVHCNQSATSLCPNYHKLPLLIVIMITLQLAPSFVKIADTSIQAAAAAAVASEPPVYAGAQMIAKHNQPHQNQNQNRHHHNYQPGDLLLVDGDDGASSLALAQVEQRKQEIREQSGRAVELSESTEADKEKISRFVSEQQLEQAQALMNERHISRNPYQDESTSVTLEREDQRSSRSDGASNRRQTRSVQLDGSDVGCQELTAVWSLMRGTYPALADHLLARATKTGGDSTHSRASQVDRHLDEAERVARLGDKKHLLSRVVANPVYARIVQHLRNQMYHQQRQVQAQQRQSAPPPVHVAKDSKHVYGRVIHYPHEAGDGGTAKTLDKLRQLSQAQQQAAAGTEKANEIDRGVQADEPSQASDESNRIRLVADGDGGSWSVYPSSNKHRHSDKDTRDELVYGRVHQRPDDQFSSARSGASSSLNTLRQLELAGSTEFPPEAYGRVLGGASSDSKSTMEKANRRLNEGHLVPVKDLFPREQLQSSSPDEDFGSISLDLSRPVGVEYTNREGKLIVVTTANPGEVFLVD